MRIVFMGTPDFAVPSLKALLAAGFHVAGVFTQPDRARGRGHKVTYSPVKAAALEANLPVFQPRRLRDPEALEALRRLAPDVIVVVAFGQLLPKEVLELPPLGCINVHASLLPKYRGAAPIQAAIAAGETVTGVTTMYMDEGLDTGDMILRREVPIGPEDDAGTMHDKLADAGAELLVETLRLVAAGAAPRTPQDDAQATYAPKVEREHAAIDWRKSAAELFHHVRAYRPWPGAYTGHRGRILKILDVVPLEDAPDAGEAQGADRAEPGRVVAVMPDGFVVQTGRGRLLVRRVPPPGAAAMSGRDYVNGYRLAAGQRLETPETAS
ncbi:MAG: methionyl-tRNA formyltransferase [Limnochordales bacterium]